MTVLYNKGRYMKIKIKVPTVLIGSDFSQQEPRVLAHMCQDERLIQNYKDGKDLYASIGAEVFNTTYWEAHQIWEDGSPNPDGKSLREITKTLVLGVMYGLGIKQMAYRFKKTEEEAKEILKKFFNMFPTIKDFVNSNKDHAMIYGQVEDYYGRVRHLPDAMLPKAFAKSFKMEQHDDIFFDIPSDRIYQVIDKEKSKEWAARFDKRLSYEVKEQLRSTALIDNTLLFDNGGFISKTMTQCTNSRIQGSSATLTKKAATDIFKNKRMQEINFKLRLFVHDEIIGEAPLEFAEEAARLLSSIMIKAAEFDENGEYGISVPMKCDTVISKSWCIEDLSNNIRNEFITECWIKYLKEEKNLEGKELDEQLHKVKRGGKTVDQIYLEKVQEGIKEKLHKSSSYIAIDKYIFDRICDGNYDITKGGLL